MRAARPRALFNPLQVKLALYAHPDIVSPDVAAGVSQKHISTMVRPAFNLAQLTVGERLDLIEELWASIRAQPELVPLGADERSVIEARRAEHRADPASAIPWDQVRAELRSDQKADERQTKAGKRKRGR